MNLKQDSEDTNRVGKQALRISESQRLAHLPGKSAWNISGMLDWQSQVLSGGNLEAVCDTRAAGLQDTSSGPAFMQSRFLLSTLPTLPSTLPNTYLKVYV